MGIGIVRGAGTNDSAKIRSANGRFGVGRRPNVNGDVEKPLKVENVIGSESDSAESGSENNQLRGPFRMIPTPRTPVRGHAGAIFLKIFVTDLAAMSRRGPLPKSLLNTVAINVDRQWQMCATVNVNGCCDMHLRVKRNGQLVAAVAGGLHAVTVANVE